MNYTIFVHCHNLRGAANTVERYKLVSYFKKFYIFDSFLIKWFFFLPGTQAKLWIFFIVNETIIEERKTEIVDNFVCDTCGHKNTSARKRKVHINLHTNKPVSCQYWQKVFNKFTYMCRNTFKTCTIRVFIHVKCVTKKLQ